MGVSESVSVFEFVFEGGWRERDAVRGFRLGAQGHPRTKPGRVKPPLRFSVPPFNFPFDPRERRVLQVLKGGSNHLSFFSFPPGI